LIELRKHIASVLAGIFIFPIAFQIVHIARHHGHDHYGCHHVCNIQSNYQTDTINTTKKINNCPICQYKFPVNKIPVFSVYEADIPIITFAFNETITGHPYLDVFESKSPRAPPLSL
jgi:hypothetical protein